MKEQWYVPLLKVNSRIFRAKPLINGQNTTRRTSRTESLMTLTTYILKLLHLFYHSYQSLNHLSYLWQLHHMDHNLAVVFQVGIIVVNFSTYFFIAYSLDIFPNFFQVSHFIFYTTFNRLGAFVLFSPSVACLKSP